MIIGRVEGCKMIDGAELRRRLDQQGRPYTELAPLLGLSVSGLHKQMRGDTAVTRQTEMLLERLEADRAEPRACGGAPPQARQPHRVV
jgi:hypothetical protein